MGDNVTLEVFQGHIQNYIRSLHGQSAGKEMANSAVFINFRRNADSDWISLTETGREFQAWEAAPLKLRPYGAIQICLLLLLLL